MHILGARLCVDHRLEVASGENSPVAARVRLRWLAACGECAHAHYCVGRRDVAAAASRRAAPRQRAAQGVTERAVRVHVAWARSGLLCGGEAAWRHLVFSSRHKPTGPRNCGGRDTYRDEIRRSTQKVLKHVQSSHAMK